MVGGVTMHDDMVVVDPETVRRLIAVQFPEWAHLPLLPLTTTGTVNSILRLGDELTVRLPLTPQEPREARALLEAEAALSAEFAAVSPVPAPRPVALGRPGAGYPLPWSVQTWLPGQDALAANPASSTAFATDLAGLLAALRQAPVQGRSFSGAGRGGHLPDHDAWMQECFLKSEGLLDVPKLRAMWAELRTLPRVDADVMTHGDLTPANVLVYDGRLAGVLDTGSFAPADPALDLVGAWHLLDATGRELLRTRLGCSEVQWRRGMAWAFQQAMGLVWYYAESNPAMAAWGSRSLERLMKAPDHAAQARASSSGARSFNNR